MKFSDIDFSALKHMVDSLSEEEKESLNEMAKAVSENMGSSFNHAAQDFSQQVAQQEEEEEDYTQYLGLSDELLDALDGAVLSDLESACDLEQFYDEIPEADLSASALFYAKAVLKLLQKHLASLFSEDLNIPLFRTPKQTTLLDYIQVLSDENNTDSLAKIGKTKEYWQQLKNQLMQIYMFLQRAEFDEVHKRDIDLMKDLLIRDALLENINDFQYLSQKS